MKAKLYLSIAFLSATSFFNAADATYPPRKAVLDGVIEERPQVSTPVQSVRAAQSNHELRRALGIKEGEFKGRKHNRRFGRI